jgi:glycosyltransferase involved in cell wall biosynthesis
MSSKNNSDTEIQQNIYISVVVPISERYDDLKRLYSYYAEELNKTEKQYEFIFVVSDYRRNALADLKELKSTHAGIRIIKIASNFGDSAALSVGFKKARGRYILTLHPYFQVEPSGIRDVIKKLDEGIDLVITRRFPRVDSVLNQMQTFAFHFLIHRLTGISFRDISCGLRGMTRRVAGELKLYGDLHRFIPLLAQMQGFKIVEIDVRQSREDSRVRVYNPGIYVRRLLDIFTIFFLFKFTKKPLRFFGFAGMSFFAAGVLLNIYLSAERLFGNVELANRPILLLGVLVMVLGIQIMSIGLLGEIIIFTHAKEIKDYQIEEILD